MAAVALTLLPAALTLLSGCASQAPVPVIERSPPVAVPAAPIPAIATPTESKAAAVTTAGVELYTVKRGDTLYSIALENGQSYRDLAAWNNLEDPNRIKVGQQLRVKPAGSDSVAPVAVSRPIALPAPIETRALGGNATPNSETLKREPRGGKLPYSEENLARLQKPEPAAPTAEPKAELKPAPPEKPSDKPVPPLAGDDAMDWAWPANGKVTANFVEGSNKGLDIAGAMGEPVLAAAAGKVILVSSALRGYGNFVIVKHNAAYLSVYAHNSRILVKEEQQVTKGQKIAEIGSSDSDQTKLHFEIRHQGKPVDPLKYLPTR
jgi:lipoprotein NlpD